MYINGSSSFTTIYWQNNVQKQFAVHLIKGNFMDKIKNKNFSLTLFQRPYVN